MKESDSVEYFSGNWNTRKSPLWSGDLGECPLTAHTLCANVSRKNVNQRQNLSISFQTLKCPPI